MNCRTFHQYLEDYLQDGLDFSVRFGMERHAQQCIRCGKDMTDAKELRRMVLELKRVKAPADFESSLLAKIGTYKAHSRFPVLQRFWIYGPEWLSWKRLMFASSGLAVLAVGVILSIHMTARKPLTPSPVIARQHEKSEDKAKPVPDIKPEPAPPTPSHAVVHTQKAWPAPSQAEVETVRSLPPMPVMGNISRPVSFNKNSVADRQPLWDPTMQETEFFEFMIQESDIRPVPVRMLPRKIRVQYVPASEEYFIQNVSH